MKSVLVVDNDEAILNIFSVFLARKGYRVITASGGCQALALCLSNMHIDVMVLDLKMPDINGIKVLKELKECKSQLPIIVVSASIGLGQSFTQLKQLGFDFRDIAYKPVDLYCLLQKIEEKLLGLAVRRE